ncbi:MAG: DegT/DnrJ/EryC1/StrS aminotransferase family protein [Planctomycetota bacterium]|jgi:dTDP-4-amino-4,6-dideoxygalactose transaminase|nr:DegT/DnrJ/EryC1/StrS aminotransferase family protein [Planctomycetota bacterium]
MSDDFIAFAPPDIGDQEVAAVVDALRSGWVTRGPRCAQFEEAAQALVQAPAALAVNSGTAAMHLALEAAGIGPGDEVIVPAMTFCSTALVVEHVRATPVLVDVEVDTLNIDPTAVERAITPKTRAIMPVHFAGHPVDLDAIHALAQAHGLLVLEDAAHAIGAAWRGAPIGSGPNPVAFSFYATKNLCTGEGGLLTGSDELVARARLLSLHGMDRDAWRRYERGGRWRYDVAASGWKYNMTDIQAALGLVQLERFEQMQAARRTVVSWYRERLAGAATGDLLSLPSERPDVIHAWHLFVIQLNLAALKIDRDAVIEQMSAAGIGTSVHFIPLHQHSHFRDTHGWQASDVPVCEVAADRVLSLPLHPRLQENQVDRVCDALLDILERGRR